MNHETMQAERSRVEREVAYTILDQMGGNMFRVMTGCKRWSICPGGASFMIGRNCKMVNCVKVVLCPDDTYTMSFLKIGSKGIKTLATVEDVYCNQLQAFFTKHTGMDTHL